jgi:hypothetical protein
MSQPNATIKLNLSELNVLLKSLKNTGMDKSDLFLFIDNTINKLEDMKQEQLDKDIQEVTNGFCQPGVNCE